MPLTMDEANAFVAEHHRHHKHGVRSCRFCLGLADGGRIRGVVIVANPVARHLDDGWTLEVRRLCTDGVSNGCSMLYAAARRAAVALRYRKLITYTLPEEGGASMRAAGFTLVALTKGGTWNTPSRPRIDRHPTHGKLRWEVTL